MSDTQMWHAGASIQLSTRVCMCSCVCIYIPIHTHTHVQEKMKTCTSAKKNCYACRIARPAMHCLQDIKNKGQYNDLKKKLQGKVYRSDILPSISRTKANATTEKTTLMLPWLRVTIIAHAIMKMPPKIKRSDRKISQRKSWSRLIVSAQSDSVSTI